MHAAKYESLPFKVSETVRLGDRTVSSFPLSFPLPGEDLRAASSPLAWGAMRLARLYGPWALVTGASSGLGTEFARQLAAEGFHLIITARRDERLRTLAAELRSTYQCKVIVVSGDLREASCLTELDEAVACRDVGLIISNAGFGASGRFLELDEERLAAMVQLNCEAPVRLLRRTTPHLLKRRTSGLIMVASTAAFQATPWMAVYGATKVFDLHFAEALTAELGPQGVDVLSVCPGHTATEFHEVAGVRQAALGGAASAEDVVRESLRCMGRRMTFVHGGLNRFMSRANRLVPRTISTWAAGRILGKRLDPDGEQQAE